MTLRPMATAGPWGCNPPGTVRAEYRGGRHGDQRVAGGPRRGFVEPGADRGRSARRPAGLAPRALFSTTARLELSESQSAG